MVGSAHSVLPRSGLLEVVCQRSQNVCLLIGPRWRDVLSLAYLWPCLWVGVALLVDSPCQIRGWLGWRVCKQCPTSLRCQVPSGIRARWVGDWRCGQVRFPPREQHIGVASKFAHRVRVAHPKLSRGTSNVCPVWRSTSAEHIGHTKGAHLH